MGVVVTLNLYKQLLWTLLPAWLRLAYGGKGIVVVPSYLGEVTKGIINIFIGKTGRVGVGFGEAMIIICIGCCIVYPQI